MRLVSEEVVMDGEGCDSSVKLHNIHIKTTEYRSQPQINSTGFSLLAISLDSTKAIPYSATSATSGRVLIARTCHSSGCREFTVSYE